MRCAAGRGASPFWFWQRVDQVPRSFCVGAACMGAQQDETVCSRRSRRRARAAVHGHAASPYLSIPPPPEDCCPSVARVTPVAPVLSPSQRICAAKLQYCIAAWCTARQRAPVRSLRCPVSHCCCQRRLLPVVPLPVTRMLVDCNAQTPAPRFAARSARSTGRRASAVHSTGQPCTSTNQVWHVCNRGKVSPVHPFRHTPPLRQDGHSPCLAAPGCPGGHRRAGAKPALIAVQSDAPSHAGRARKRIRQIRRQ